MSPALRRGWLAASVVMLAVCVFFGWQSWQLSLSDRLGPGPGFFPFWLSLIGGVLSIAIGVGAARSRPEADEPLWPRADGLGRIFAILGAIAAAAALLDILGYRITALLFLGALAPLLGARSPLAIAIVALVGSFGVYLVFNDWLDVILPVGPFGV